MKIGQEQVILVLDFGQGGYCGIKELYTNQ
jgi:hypothetical protein